MERKAFFGLVERPVFVLVEPLRHPCHRVTARGIELRVMLICFFPALLLAIKSFDRGIQNRSWIEVVILGVLAGTVLLLNYEWQLGSRTLIAYEDRLRLRHRFGIWPLRYIFGKLEWTFDEIESVVVTTTADDAMLTINPKARAAVDFGLASVSEAVAATCYLHESGVIVDPKPPDDLFFCCEEDSIDPDATGERGG